ncbi:MAG: amidohydrolase [Pseudomonadota bacterium]
MQIGNLNVVRLALLGSALCAAAAAQAAAKAGAAADLILTNARVYTVEKAQPWAGAVSIKDGHIQAVGSAAAVGKHRGPNTQVVDLGGRLLMPAFGDAHAHPVFGGMSYARCSLHTGKTIEDYQRIIAGCVNSTPGTAAIYGFGWLDALFPPSGLPRKEVLDAVSKDRPLIFTSVGGHSMWLNSKALALAKITKDTPDPANGQIDRDPKSGEPSGSLQEAAMELADSVIPPPTQADAETAIAYTAKMLNSLGVTSWHDAGVDYEEDGSSPTITAYRAVRDRGDLHQHVTIALKWKNERGLDQLPAMQRAFDKTKALGFTSNSVKFYVDGVIPQKTAAMLAPYEDAHDHSHATKGAPQISEDVLKQAVTALDAKGVQAYFHAIGDGAVRETLDAVEAARATNGPSDTRPMVAHLNIVDPADQPRFAKLNMTAQFQAAWAANYPYMDLTKQAVGPTRSTYIYPAGSILKYGGRLAYGADWPVGTANPFEGLEVAVTRTNFDLPTTGPLLPGESVTLEQAVAAHTIDVAYVNHLDTQLGSIAKGKFADLIVVDRDIFSIPITDVSKAKVLVTFFEGKPVYGDLATLTR